MSRSKRDPEKEAFWRLVLEEHQRSGLSAREFCRNEGLAESSFHSWKRVLADRDQESKTPARPSAGHGPRSGQGKRLAPKNQDKKPSTGENSFVPVEVVPSPIATSQELTIRTPAGFTIDLPAAVDIVRFGQVLEVLGKQAPSSIRDVS